MNGINRKSGSRWPIIRIVQSATLLLAPIISIALTNSLSAAEAGSDPGAHTNKGVRFAHQKHYDRAIAEFTAAIKIQPNDPKNYENRAMAYRLTGKRDDAVRDLL